MFLNTHNQHINVLYKCKYMQTHNVATLPSESDWKGVYLADCMQTQPVIFASTLYPVSAIDLCKRIERVAFQ